MAGTTKKLLPCYLVAGSDSVKQTRVVERLKTHVNKDFYDFNCDVIIVNSETLVQDVIASAQTMPFGDGIRLVIVDCGQKPNKELADGLALYLKDPNPDVCLCILATSLDKRSKLYKAVKALGKDSIIDCAEKKAWELPGVVCKMANAQGMQMSEDAAKELVTRTGENTKYLQTQIKTLVALKGNDKQITLEDVRNNVNWTAEIKPWTFTDAVCERNTVYALELLERMENPVYILLHTMMVRRLRELLCAKCCMQTRRSSISHELSCAYGKIKKDGSRGVYAQDWQLKNHSRWASKFSEKELVDALRAAEACERGLKGGADNQKTCFIQFITSITIPANHS